VGNPTAPCYCSGAHGTLDDVPMPGAVSGQNAIGPASHRPARTSPWSTPLNPRFSRFYEIPLAIQDRSFNSDGSLFYPNTREFFDQFGGPYIPGSDVPPIWNPEFFGSTIVVNGRTWPFLEVEPRRYRFRCLNGCNSRFLILKIVSDPLASRPASAELRFCQIGADGGCLWKPVQLDQLLMAPAERADVIVDFTRLRVGTELYLVNEGPDEPFGGGVPGTDFPAVDPESTGQVMKFVLVRRTSVAPAMIPPGSRCQLSKR
jgi:spore coat protein A